MALLKRKAEPNETISIRVPASVKHEMVALRPLAEEKGFDLTASLTDAVLQWVRQIRKELGGADAKPDGAVTAQSNGLGHGREENGVGGYRGSGIKQD